MIKRTKFYYITKNGKYFCFDNVKCLKEEYYVSIALATAQHKMQTCISNPDFSNILTNVLTGEKESVIFKDVIDVQPVL